MEIVRRLRAERDALLEALKEVLRYDDLYHPCDHEPDPVCCTHCYARDLIAEYDRREAA